MAHVEQLLGGLPGHMEHGYHIYHADSDHILDLRELYTKTGDQRALTEDNAYWPTPDEKLGYATWTNGLFVGGEHLRSKAMGRIITAAMVTFDTPKDQELWQRTGIDLTDGVNVHRLATQPEHQGKGYAGSLLGYISFRAANAGVNNLYLDCYQDAEPLRAFYEHIGFDLVDTVERPGNGYRAALYVRPTGPYAEYGTVEDNRLRYGKMKRIIWSAEADMSAAMRADWPRMKAARMAQFAKAT